MAVTTPSRPRLGVPQRPLRRSSTNLILGGVCGGIAVRLGVRERTVRIIFALASFVFGVGPLVYVALWLLLPRSGEDRSIAQRLTGRRHQAQSILIVLIVAVVFLGVRRLSIHHSGGFGFAGSPSLGLPGFGGFVWTILISALGVFVIWRGSSVQEREGLQGLANSAPIIGAASTRGWRSVAIRLIPGVILVVVGVNILNQLGGIWSAAVPALIGAAIVIVGLLILFAPWWLHNVRELSDERRERVRIEERASMVAHIHDSVLQTLTLIERAAARESDVVRLARAQERELRQWLFDPDSIGGANTAPTTLTTLLGQVERDIENDYGVKVELVTVGDCPSDGDVAALVGAGREAGINAAKWSGATTISVFAEVEQERISLYVRDTGCGFDPRSVAKDRQGIALSIHQRMNQHGGTAVVTSAPGAGTNVELQLPRSVK